MLPNMEMVLFVIHYDVRVELSNSKVSVMYTRDCTCKLRPQTNTLFGLNVLK